MITIIAIMLLMILFFLIMSSLFIYVCKPYHTHISVLYRFKTRISHSQKHGNSLYRIILYRNEFYILLKSVLIWKKKLIELKGEKQLTKLKKLEQLMEINSRRKLSRVFKRLR